MEADQNDREEAILEDLVAAIEEGIFVHQEEEDNGETVRETKVEIQNEDLDQIDQEDIEDVNSIVF